MTRDQLIQATRHLVAEGERLAAAPSLVALRVWLQRSDDLLAEAWGSMDRYHLAWLSVGKPRNIVRGRAMTSEEEAAYVREVADQKTAALRMSLDAIERQRMPFRGETGGVGVGQGMGEVPGEHGPGAAAETMTGAGPTGAAAGAAVAGDGGGRARFDLPPEADDLAARLREAREAGARHAADEHRPRAPRPERMQR